LSYDTTRKNPPYVNFVLDNPPIVDHGLPRTQARETTMQATVHLTSAAMDGGVKLETGSQKGTVTLTIDGRTTLVRADELIKATNMVAAFNA
jgi:hypothetical protein